MAVERGQEIEEYYIGESGFTKSRTALHRHRRSKLRLTFCAGSRINRPGSHLSYNMVAHTILLPESIRWPKWQSGHVTYNLNVLHHMFSHRPPPNNLSQPYSSLPKTPQFCPAQTHLSRNTDGATTAPQTSAQGEAALPASASTRS
jgi:hypothetical protein